MSASRCAVVLVLDALGDDPQAEVVAEVDGAAHDRRVAGLGELAG